MPVSTTLANALNNRLCVDAINQVSRCKAFRHKRGDSAIPLTLCDRGHDNDAKVGDNKREPHTGGGKRKMHPAQGSFTSCRVDYTTKDTEDAGDFSGRTAHPDPGNRIRR